jgi:hypothetical protein
MVRNGNTSRSGDEYTRRLRSTPGKTCKESQWNCDQSEKETADESEKVTF